jgi:hypothetical protein
MICRTIADARPRKRRPIVLIVSKKTLVGERSPPGARV